MRLCNGQGNSITLVISRMYNFKRRVSYLDRETYQTTQQVMVRSLPQRNVPHVAHDDIFRHVGRTVEDDVFVTPSENIPVNIFEMREEKSRDVMEFARCTVRE